MVLLVFPEDSQLSHCTLSHALRPPDKSETSSWFFSSLKIPRFRISAALFILDRRILHIKYQDKKLICKERKMHHRVNVFKNLPTEEHI